MLFAVPAATNVSAHNIQIKGKVELYSERSSALPYTLV